MTCVSRHPDHCLVCRQMDPSSRYLFVFISYLPLCRKFGLCGTSEEQILCTIYRSFCTASGRRGSFTVKGAFIEVLCCSQVSWGHSCPSRSACVNPLMTLYRIGHNLLLFFRRSPILLRRITISSAVGVGARNTAVFRPPATDMRFELSPVPPNPLGEGRWIKTAAALVIGCVVVEIDHFSRNSLNGSPTPLKR
jgi:hypothetical protein